MNWEDESYVRVYTRDTTDWVMLSWEARCVFLHLLRKVDRAGFIYVGKHGLRGIAKMIDGPVDVVERAVPELVEDGCLEIGTHDNKRFIGIPNFVEAQSATKSPKQRQREYRAKRRDLLRAGKITPEDFDGNHESLQNVEHHNTSVQPGPKLSNLVTPSLAKPSQTKHIKARSGDKPRGQKTHEKRREFMDAFHQLFLERMDSKPSWTARHRGLINQLAHLAKGDVRELGRRASRMFDLRGRFPAEHPDLPTLVTHWDKFIPPKANSAVGCFDADPETDYAGGEV